MEEEKSYQEIRKDLILKYKKEVVPKLLKYERERQKYYFQSKLARNTILILYIITIIFYFYLMIKYAKFETPFIFSLFLAFAMLLPIAVPFVLVWMFITKKIGKGFIPRIKNTIMPLICSCFPNLKWVPKRTHSTREYENSRVLAKFDYINYDDCFVGKYKDVDFVIEELFTQKRGRKGGRKYTIFFGVVIQFEINKKFNGHTIIYPVSDIIFNQSPLYKLHYTELEDINFQKKYKVFTDDDVEARYLITPSLMERLKKVKVNFDAEKMYVAFYNGKMFVSLYTFENLFEIEDLRKPLCNEGQLFKMGEEIISILKLIDHFKLDQKIGM